MVGFFARMNESALFVRNLATNLSRTPLIAQLFLGAALRDDFQLPEYGA
jgi:hypothetical protein